MWSVKNLTASLFFFFCTIAGSSGILPVGISAAQTVSPSVYVGLGTGTNLGGTLGTGVEVRLGKHFSANAAVGAWPEILGELGGAFDFDIGVKVYPLSRWFFSGLNYGIIHAEVLTSSQDGTLDLRKRRGLTLSVGLRTAAFHRFYASSFAGVTGDGEANHFTVFDRRTFMPHIGLMIGYELFAGQSNQTRP